MNYKRYKRSNALQEYVYSLLSGLTREDYERVGLSVYTPKLNKLKIGLSICLILFCLLTPFTNFLIPYIVRWVVK